MVGSRYERLYKRYHQERTEKKRQRLYRSEMYGRRRLLNYLRKNPGINYKEIPQQYHPIIKTIYHGRINKARYDANVPLKFGGGLKLPKDKEAYLFLLYNLGYSIKDLASGFNLPEEKTYNLINRIEKISESPLKKFRKLYGINKLSKINNIDNLLKMKLYTLNRGDPYRSFIQQILKLNKLEIALEDISEEIKSRFDATLDIYLGSRSKDMLYSRFGLITNEPKSLENVGMEYELSGERTRQIEKISIKRLSLLPNLERTIKYIIEGKTEFDDKRKV